MVPKSIGQRVTSARRVHKGYKGQGRRRRKRAMRSSIRLKQKTKRPRKMYK